MDENVSGLVSKNAFVFCVKILDLIRKEQLDEAADMLNNWKASEGASSYLSASMEGVLHRASGRPDLAVKPEELALKLGGFAHSVSARARLLGNRAVAANQLELAACYYGIGMNSDPCDMRLPLNLSAIYMRSRQFREAIALALEANLTGKMFGWPQRLIEKASNRFLEAMAKLDDASRIECSAKLIPVWKAHFHWKANIRTNLALTDKSADHPMYQVEYLLAYVWSAIHRHPAVAGQHLDAAISIRPEAANTYAERAVCRLHLGGWPEALLDAELALQLAQTDSLRARGIWLQGLGLFGLGRIREANRSFEQAAKMRPDVAVYADCAEQLASVNLRSLGAHRRFVAAAAITKPL